MNTKEIYPINNAPQIAGLIFRHFEGESDYPKMLAIYTNLHAAGQYSGETTLKSLEAEFNNLSNCDPHYDVIFAEVDGQTIAFCRFYWERQISTREYAYGIIVRVDTAWQTKGIEQARINWGESRGRQYAPPARRECRFVLLEPAKLTRAFRILTELDTNKR